MQQKHEEVYQVVPEHTHVEVRNGRQGYASKSVNDPILNNENPTSFWNSQGYNIK